jgi:hypothetical protein
MRETDSSEIALLGLEQLNQIGHDGDVTHTETKPCRDSQHNAVVGK